jgi:hypothetical protein
MATSSQTAAIEPRLWTLSQVAGYLGLQRTGFENVLRELRKQGFPNALADPPPVKWSIPMYGFIEEDRDAEKASQAGGDRCQASSG